MTNFTHITMSKDTKRAQSFIKRYNLSRLGNSIYTAYKKPSNAKVEAFNVIKKEMEDIGGTDMRITGAGSNFFSCAYKLKNSLVVHVPTDVFVIKDVFNS